jgi:uncharacterized protein (TIGR02444 family)
MSLWDWTSAAYGRPGVAEACLELQDRHGQSVPFLLWAVWARADDAELLAEAADSVRAWEKVATLPLRGVRRDLKTPRPPIDDTDRESVRNGAADVELVAEKAILQALEALTPTPPRGRAGPAEALAAAAAAWSGEVPGGPLDALAQALSKGLLFEASGRHDPAPESDLQGPMDDEDGEWERDLRARLAIITQDHADLDVAIQALAASTLPDMLVISRLKRKKLALKDEIARILDDLTPDIIA